MRNTLFCLVLCLVITSVTAAQGTAIETVPVGDPGNVGDASGEGAGGYGPTRICGAVDYTYRIGMFEVTAGQYTAFLNAAAAIDDAHGLYNPEMASHEMGCGIQRSGQGSDGDPFVYTVPGDRAQRPVNFVNWYDAARFCNWMTVGNTETGAYDLTGGDTMAVTRSHGAIYALPTEDEWYKAAFYNADSASYYDFPTQSDSAPGNDLLSPDPGNSANYWAGGTDYTLGAPDWTTEVGAFASSASPYGTFDQGGNVWEWTEQAWDDEARVARGGSFLNTWYDHLMAQHRGRLGAADHHAIAGFRVVLVPEPGSLALLMAGGLVLARRRQ